MKFTLTRDAGGLTCEQIQEAGNRQYTTVQLANQKAFLVGLVLFLARGNARRFVLGFIDLGVVLLVERHEEEQGNVVGR